jgi:hypothetical protein
VRVKGVVRVDAMADGTADVGVGMDAVSGRRRVRLDLLTATLRVLWPVSRVRKARLVKALRERMEAAVGADAVDGVVDAAAVVSRERPQRAARLRLELQARRVDLSRGLKMPMSL